MRLFHRAALALSFLGALVGCGDGEGGGPSGSQIAIVLADSVPPVIVRGDTFRVVFKVLGADSLPLDPPEEYEIEWGTSDPEILTVSPGGRFRAIGDGVVEVIARVGDVEGRYETQVLSDGCGRLAAVRSWGMDFYSQTMGGAWEDGITGYGGWTQQTELLMTLADGQMNLPGDPPAISWATSGDGALFSGAPAIGHITADDYWISGEDSIPYIVNDTTPRGYGVLYLRMTDCTFGTYAGGVIDDVDSVVGQPGGDAIGPEITVAEAFAGLEYWLMNDNTMPMAYWQDIFGFDGPVYAPFGEVADSLFLQLPNMTPLNGQSLVHIEATPAEWGPPPTLVALRTLVARQAAVQGAIDRRFADRVRLWRR